MKVINKLLPACILSIAGSQVGAVEVVITDISGKPISCGALTVLNQDSVKISISTSGSCTTDAGTDGQQQDDGGYDGNGEIGGNDASSGNDSNQDGSGGGGGSGSGSSCSASGNAVCKGYSKILEVGGSLQDIPMKAGEIHVWEFKYTALSAYSDKIKALGIESTVDLEFTINQNAGSMEASSPTCERQKNFIAFTNDQSLSKWMCTLVEGQNYFLNVRNLDSFGGEYTIGR